MKGRVCYIVSDIYKSLSFEWIALRLKDQYELSFILLNPGESPIEQFLKDNSINVHRVAYEGKVDLLPATFRVYRLLRKLKPSVVHCHLLDAQLVGLSAARMAGIKRRIYTRHNSNFHHAYHPRGVYYDRISNFLSTRIISISQATDYTLHKLEQVRKDKIRKIPHGFDFSAFVNVSAHRIDDVRRRWSIPDNTIVIGVIARHIEWKGIQYIIPAFKRIAESYPDAILVLANATGPYHQKIDDDVRGLRVIQIPFEEDVAALYKTFSVYLHTPVDAIVEAFGQTYVEALAVGIPSVFTLSGIAPEFIRDGRNALVVNFKDSASIFEAIQRLIPDEALRIHLIRNGIEDVLSHFGIDKMITQLGHLYDE